METAEKLITENLDVWTSAVKTKSSAGRGSSNKRELYGIQKLRELILDLAVRGMLVPQDSDDEPASELLKSVQKKEVELVKNKKLKKTKKLPPIPDEQIPFGIPSGWEWCKLGGLGLIGSSSRVHKKDWQDQGIPFLRAREIIRLSKTGRVDNELFITEERFKKLSKDGLVPEAGDLMITGVGSIGVPYIVTEQDRFYFKDASVLIFKNYADLYPDYLFLLLRSPYWIGRIHEDSMGTTVHTLTISRAKIVPLPIPPLAEQHRIVAKVDELMALCDQLEQEQASSLDTHETLVATLLGALTEAAASAEAFAQAWQRIQANFDTLFTTESSIDQLKQTILQLAVMGKLVPQDPEDEPANALLDRIATEKAKLVKEKKIKKQQKLPPVDESEFPFSPPSGWKFERIGNLTSKLGSGSTPRGGKSAYVSDGVIFLRSQNVWNDGLRLDDTAYIPDETHEVMNNTQVFPRDVLLNITGASLGRSTIFPESLVTANVSQHVTIIRLVEPAMAEFLHLGILSPLVQKLVWGRQVGMAIEGLSKKVLEKFEFPIPPLAEQHRIVAKVDELMALCDQLKASLATAQATQLNLADSLVEQAIA